MGGIMSVDVSGMSLTPKKLIVLRGLIGWDR